MEDFTRILLSVLIILQPSCYYWSNLRDHQEHIEKEKVINKRILPFVFAENSTIALNNAFRKKNYTQDPQSNIKAMRFLVTKFQ